MSCKYCNHLFELDKLYAPINNENKPSEKYTVECPKCKSFAKLYLPLGYGSEALFRYRNKKYLQNN